MTRRNLSVLVLGAAVAAAGPARAQTSDAYLLQDAVTDYQAAQGGTTLFADSDDGVSEVVLPFPFTFFNRSYPKAWVSVNGAVTFKGTDLAGGLLPIPGVNLALPASAQPQLMIAALWDDWVATPRAPGGGSAVVLAVEGTEPARQLVIDWQRVQPYGATGLDKPALSFQLRLYELTGEYEVRFGPRLDPTPPEGSTDAPAEIQVSATSGSENALGTQGLDHLGCGALCTRADAAARGGRHVVPNLNAELALVLESAGFENGNPAFRVVVTNVGNTAAQNVRYRVWLSADRAVDAATDLLLVEDVIPTLAAVIGEHEERVVVPLDAAQRGSWYFVGKADPDNEVFELNKANNVAATSAPFYAGPELTSRVRGGRTLVAGGTSIVRATLVNLGIAPALGVRAAILFRGELLGGEPHIALRSDPVDVPADGATELVLVVPVPAMLPAGQYSLDALADSDQAVVETDETNNGAEVALAVEVHGADADVVSVAAGVAKAAQGATFPVQVVMANTGLANAEGFTFGVFLSANDVITLRDRLVYTSPAQDLSAGERRTYTIGVQVPADLAPGDWYVGVIADAEGKVNDGDRLNNVRRTSGVVTIILPAGDPAVVSASAGARAVAGEALRVEALVANAGSREIAVPVAVHLSANDTISAADRRLGGTSVQLAAGAQRVVGLDVPVPVDLRPGLWRLGVLVDRAAATENPETGNDAALAPAAVEVLPAALAITTQALPDAVAGAAYSVQLAARGGFGDYAWSVAAGQLPAGLSLSAAGVLSGTPTAPGAGAFTAAVRSAGIEAHRVFSLAVEAHAASLGLLDTVLPPARKGIYYAAKVGAAGGTPDYVLTCAAGLPPGLVFGADGAIAGVPTVAGSFDLAVVLEDAAAHRAEATVHLEVYAEAPLQLGGSEFSPRLRDLEAGRPQAITIPVTGGLAPYDVRVVRGALPAGLSVEIAESGVAVVVGGTPVETGSFEFAVELSDSRGELDFASMLVRVLPRALRFTTTLLPPAVPGEVYLATLATNAKPPAVFELVAGSLPPGLGLEGAVIAGVVPADAAARPWAFAVRVRDATGGEAVSPFVIEVPAPALPVEEGGCASTGAGAGALALALLLALRRRRGAAALVAGLALLAPGAALAQYRIERSVTPYVQLDDEESTQLFDFESAASTYSKSINLPFSFKYFGTATTQIGVTTRGILKFGSVSSADESSSNVAIPTAGTPNNVVMVWWDYLRVPERTPGGPGLVHWELEGEEPNRVAVIEWRNMQAYSYQGNGYASFSFQARLHEGTNVLELSYGGEGTGSGALPPMSATMGFESSDGKRGQELLGCSPSCVAADFPVDVRYRLTASPELTIATPQVPASVLAGVPFTARVDVSNTGLLEARPVYVRFIASADALVDENDLVVGVSTPHMLSPGALRTISTNVTIPVAGLPPRVYLGAVVDPADQILEIDEENNLAPTVVLGVKAPGPDFAATRLVLATELAVGTAAPAVYTLANVGTAAGAGTWRIVLSDNALVTSADRTLAEGSFDLGAGTSLDGATDLTLSAQTPPGEYWLGLLVRAATGTTELEALGNDLVFGPVHVLGGALAVATATLPSATAGVPFSFQLAASGGSGSAVWSAGSPAPPDGVTLTAAGQLYGRLDSPGEWAVQVRVASEGELAARTLTLRATGGASPLSLVSARLPIGVTGQAYAGRLAARGGTPPYAWALEGSSALPPGLRLDPSGAVEGVTLADGAFALQVKVTDTAGASAAGEVVLPVAGPQRPLLATERLPTATLGQALSTTLLAAGGRAPYRFVAVDTRRVPSDPADKGTTYSQQPPPGLALSEAGALSGTPTVAGLFELFLRVIDADNREDTGAFLLAVQAPSDLEVVTTALPDGRLNEAYSVALVARGGQGGLVWEAIFSDGGGLPAGMTFTDTGRLGGTPRAVGTASFLAIVRDGAGRSAMQALALKVVEPPAPVEDEGCAQSAAGLAGAAVALLALLRRRARRLAAPLAALACALVLPGCTEEKKSNCATPCAAPLVCDELDGLCKCAEAGGAVCGAGESCDATTRQCLRASCATTCPAPTVCGLDGACHCAGAAGPVCEAGEQCLPTGKCAPTDPCAGVRCAAGMSCDPGAQGACRCGAGAACAAGQRCVDAQCVADKCLGVGCTGGTSCDPADGQCKCGGAGGAQCTGGEACDAARARCLRSARCDGVACAEGNVCDPADGQCKCGAPTGPKCGAGQWCDPVARRCEGGDLCAGSSCQGGQSCDPEDGACKCGGAGGVSCATGQVCVGSGSSRACRTACQLLVDACGTGEACQWDDDAEVSWCMVAGSARRNQACSLDEPCAARLYCVKPVGSATTVCRDYCTRDENCPAGQGCAYFNAGGTVGVCLETE